MAQGREELSLLPEQKVGGSHSQNPYLERVNNINICLKLIEEVNMLRSMLIAIMVLACLGIPIFGFAGDTERTIVISCGLSITVSRTLEHYVLLEN